MVCANATFARLPRSYRGQVTNDPSVAASRDCAPETLSVSQCLDHFLEREQLDESEMWYCSSCKVGPGGVRDDAGSDGMQTPSLLMRGRQMCAAPHHSAFPLLLLYCFGVD